MEKEKYFLQKPNVTKMFNTLLRLDIIGVIIVIDQITKFLAIQFLSNETVRLLPYLSLAFYKNTGIVFGWLEGMNTVLIFITAGIIFLLLCLKTDKPFNNLMLSFIISGAIGNLIDRIIHGGVIDFINLEFWTIFNVADLSITVGVIGLLLASIQHG